MKKFLVLLNTPARAVITVGLLILLGEFLIMMLIEDAITPFVTHELWHLIDPILLIAIVSPAFYLLIFRPLRKRQIEIEDARKKIEQAHQEWIAALDTVNDPIFLHDKDFRILRCNKAYQQCAGFPFHEIIGQPYYTIFPKNHTPLLSCRRAMEKAEEEEEEEEVTVGGVIYRSRAYSIHDKQGAYLYSIHTLEDISESRQAAEELRLRAQLLDSTADSIFVADFDGNFVYLNEASWKMRGYTQDELMAMNLRVLDTPEYEWLLDTRFRELQEKGQCIFESAHRRKDGTVMPIEVSARVIETGGRWLVLAAVRDITERKLAESKLAEQLEELRRWYDATLGREIRILDLKREVNELLGQTGQPPRYPSAESDGQQEK